jgi:hypothetical protein|nr:MAG TPA_asm: hypothetical protein [Caudoviricetes sp.]
MDVERMYCMIEKLAECAEKQFNAGIENVDTCEMGKVTDMLKDLAEAMYYRELTKAMQESDTEEVMEMFDRYGDGRRSYDHYRYGDGRFAPKGKGSYRRGYDEPPYWHMTPEMYRKMEDYRDYDRKDGRMYYTEPMTMKESSYDRAKRNYTESRELHRANTPQDKEAKMKDLDGYFKEISSDLTELIGDMTPEERSMLKAKIATLSTKL